MATMPGSEMTVDPRAIDLLERSRRDPMAVLEEGDRLIDDLQNPNSVAVALRAMSLAARLGGTMEQSVDYARAGAEVAVDGTIRRECLLTMAGSTSNRAAALSILDEASIGAEGLVAGQILFQRGFVLGPAGEYKESHAAFTKALTVFEEFGRSDFVAMTLHNLGNIYTQTGQLDKAESALEKARRLEEDLGHHMEVSGTDNNLGKLASYRGDIPEALRRLAMSDEREMRYAGADMPRHVTRAELLITAGLFREALDLAKRIAAGARDAGRREDEADAVLVAARAAGLAGHTDQAIKLAELAVRQNVDIGRPNWAAQAEAILIEARYDEAGPSEDLYADATRAAETLDEGSLAVEASRARLLAGRIALDLGDVNAARSEFTRLGDGRSGPVELRVQRSLAKALLRLSEGDKQGADAAARAGLDLLEEYQRGLGASDLRSGIERQGAELGEIGLRLAVESGTPRRIFRWMERTRGRALRHAPVVPSADDPEQPVLAELRRISADMRDPDRRADRVLMRRRRQLQDQLRASNRARRGGGRVEDLTLDGIVDTLGDRTLIELAEVLGSLLAVVIRNGRFRVHDLGDTASADESLSRLMFGMRRAARLGRDPAPLRRDVAEFDRIVLGRIGPLEGDVVLVPSGRLLAAPWSVAPSLSAATFTLAPSAEMWARAHRKEGTGEGVVLAAGPDLAQARAEIEELRAIYRDATVLEPDDPTSSFGEAIRGAAVTHAACHATFEVENPMFSSLRLGDGDFNVYDMERLGQVPDVMVLSACDSGYTSAQAGDELTGFTSALLGMGSRAIVASVGLVPDSAATGDLMIRMHRHLSAGEYPSSALARARSELIDSPEGFLTAASFVVVGGI